MDGVNNELKPAFLHGIWTSEPFVAKDDTILFLSITNEMDGLPPKPENYDLFLKKGGTIKRITKDQGYRFIMYPSISFDGKRIFFKGARHIDIDKDNTISSYIINSDGAGLTKIVLPQIENTEP
jgi:Tol biopolymer transport system component